MEGFLLIFDCFQDPLLDLLQNIVSLDRFSLRGLLDKIDPGLLEYDKMAWFYKVRNEITFLNFVEHFGRSNNLSQTSFTIFEG